jgi:hypothetical protein
VANLGNTFTAHPESRLPAPLAGNLCPVTFRHAGRVLGADLYSKKKERSRRGLVERSFTGHAELLCKSVRHLDVLGESV